MSVKDRKATLTDLLKGLRALSHWEPLIDFDLKETWTLTDCEGNAIMFHERDEAIKMKEALDLLCDEDLVMLVAELLKECKSP